MEKYADREPTHLLKVKMTEGPKIPLDYSSLANEHSRETQRESERREALANYDEASVGQRHPFAEAILHTVVLMVVLVLLIWFLPRTIGLASALVTTLVFALWERVRHR